MNAEWETWGVVWDEDNDPVGHFFGRPTTLGRYEFCWTTDRQGQVAPPQPYYTTTKTMPFQDFEAWVEFEWGFRLTLYKSAGEASGYPIGWKLEV